MSLDPILSPDEGHPDPLAQLRERGVLGHEAPAHPRGVGARLAQGALEDRVVEIGPAGRRAQVVRGIRLADEHGGALTLGVEGDRLDPVAARPRLGVEVTHGMDEPHRGLPTVDDGDPLEHRWSSQGCGVGVVCGGVASAVRRACHHLVVTRE
jgi:hypothetical protein